MLFNSRAVQSFFVFNLFFHQNVSFLTVALRKGQKVMGWQRVFVPASQMVQIQERACTLQFFSK